MRKNQKDWLGSGWMVVAAALFTLMNLWVKQAGLRYGFGTGELVFWRMLFAVVALGVWGAIRRKTFATPYIKAHLNRSISGTLGMFFIFYAVVNLPLATGVTLSYTSSIFLALLSFLVLKEKIPAYTQMMLVLGFVGVVVLLNPSFASGQAFAAVVGLLGGLLAGWAYLQVRELSLLGEPSWRVVFYLSLTGTVMGAIWSGLTGWHLPSGEAWWHLLGIGASAMGAQLAMTHAYKVGRKFTVAALAYLTVVFSTLAGIFLLGDKIGWQEWLGMVIIVSSGLLSVLKK
ncbi:MAG: DMT family transporter [Neisseria sp.]|uniref:DMT family transporter n=1 Tax=Neisseria sp. TaxID=192066 RepID=UPI0026DD438C|nr:DMT family transporter [Neisseria sp.]MDO4640812.1 DMT family transporter [Neisseria sp.]